MSDIPAPSPALEALAEVEALLAARAAALELTMEAQPNYAVGLFAGGSDTPSARLEKGDLPNHARGFKVGRYPVLLTLLPEAASEEALRDVIRRVRNQCVVARSYLSPSAALDLHAILIGPRGSEGVDRWRSLALIAERDERVARKLVWLRPVEGCEDKASFDEFSKRTFLARPWATDAVFSMAPLDNVSRAAALGEIPRNTAGEWVRLASQSDVEPDTLVEQLVASWQRRSG